MTPSLDWTVEVTTVIPAKGCPWGPRTEAHIQDTIKHELRHVDYYMNVINSYKSQIGIVYPTQGECDAALNVLIINLGIDWEAMYQRQEVRHDDFRGDPLYYPVCRGGVATELLSPETY